MSHEAHPLSPLLLLAVDAGLGGIVSHVAHAVAHVPPSITGAATALLFGAVLRFAGPTIDHHGARAAAWMTGSHKAPKGLARCVLIVEDHPSGEVLAALLRTALDVGPTVLAELGPGQSLSSYARRMRPAPVAAVPAVVNVRPPAKVWPPWKKIRSPGANRVALTLLIDCQGVAVEVPLLLSLPSGLT